MSEHNAPYMRWHVEGCTKDGVLRHLANGEAWKSFDLLHTEFFSGQQDRKAWTKLG
jgi:hypothetical protein